MKEMVTRACGHTHQVEIFGTAAARANKIKWYESTDCAECAAAEKNADCEIIEMSYADYKTNHSDCDTVPNSYDKSTKTIKVYVHLAPAEPEITTTDSKNFYDEDLIIDNVELNNGDWSSLAHDGTSVYRITANDDATDLLVKYLGKRSN